MCRWYEDRGAWIDKKPALGTLLLERVTQAQVKSGGMLEVIAPRSGSTEPYTLAADDGSAARNDTTAREWVHQIKEAKKEARRLAAQQQKRPARRAALIPGRSAQTRVRDKSLHRLMPGDRGLHAYRRFFRAFPP